MSFPSVSQPKNLELRDILRIGLNFLTFLQESEKPEEGTWCSPFLYEIKWFAFFTLQRHTILLVEKSGSEEIVFPVPPGLYGIQFSILLLGKNICNTDD